MPLFAPGAITITTLFHFDNSHIYLRMHSTFCTYHYHPLNFSQAHSHNSLPPLCKPYLLSISLTPSSSTLAPYHFTYAIRLISNLFPASVQISLGNCQVCTFLSLSLSTHTYFMVTNLYQLIVCNNYYKLTTSNYRIIFIICI